MEIQDGKLILLFYGVEQTPMENVGEDLHKKKPQCSIETCSKMFRKFIISRIIVTFKT